MKKIISASFIAMLLVLSGCATVDPKAVQASTTGKTIAVASTAGEKINLMWIGTTVFNNEYASLPSSDWELDGTIAKEAVAALQKTRRYPQVFSLEGVNRKSEGFPNVGSGQKPDFFVLFEPGLFGDPAFGTNQNMRGIGIYKRTVFNSMPITVGHVGLKAEVFDTQSGQSLGTYGLVNFWRTPIAMETGPKVSDAGLLQFKESSLTQIQNTVGAILEKLGLQ